MPRQLLFAKNNVAGTLAAGIGAPDVTATLSSGQGALFPSDEDCPYHVTVSLPGNRAINEILHVTERTGDTLTFTRGAEGTTPRAWSAESPVELWQTAQQFTDLNRMVKTLEWFLSMAWGGGDGVIRYGADPNDGLKPVPGGGLRVTVQPGGAFVNGLVFRLTSAYTSPEFAAPAPYPRIDLIQADAGAEVLTVKQGVVAQSPIAPEPDADCLVLAHVYCRPGMTSIGAADNGSNGYITDRRVFL